MTYAMPKNLRKFNPFPSHRMRKGRITAPQCVRDRFLDIFIATGLHWRRWQEYTGIFREKYYRLLHDRHYHPSRKTLAAIAKLEKMFAEDIARYRAFPGRYNALARIKRGELKVDKQQVSVVETRRRSEHSKWYYEEYRNPHSYLRAARAAACGYYREIVESWSHD